MDYINWINLKKINSSKFINSMYIWIFVVPIFVKAFEFVDGKYSFIIFNETIILNLTLPFSLIYFYFSALFFAIANLLYMTKCPTIIKENNSFSDFEKAGKKRTHIMNYCIQLNKDINKVNSYIKYTQGDKTFGWEPDDKDYFWYLHSLAEKENKGYYHITLVTYSIGILLFMIVLFQNLFEVIKLIY